MINWLVGCVGEVMRAGQGEQNIIVSTLTMQSSKMNLTSDISYVLGFCIYMSIAAYLPF